MRLWSSFPSKVSSQDIVEVEVSKRTLKQRDFDLGDFILYRILQVLLYATGTRRPEAAWIRVEDIETLADPQPSSHSDL